MKSFSKKFRYLFDNLMSKGTGSLIGMLALITLIFILIAVSIEVVFSVPNPNGTEDMSFWENFWATLMGILDSGYMASETGLLGRIMFFLITLWGIFVASTLIGLLSAGIESKIENLRKGRSLVLEKNHTLILGWSSKIFTIIPELIEANQSNQHIKSAAIVILADRDKVEMEDEIRERIGKSRKTKIICRSGNPYDPDDLKIANPNTTKSIIVLSQQGHHSDFETIKTLLAITKNRDDERQTPFHIIAEIQERKNLGVARIAGNYNTLPHGNATQNTSQVQLILSDDIISRITAQTCRQSGLSIVYKELLDFKGMEIYFKPAGTLAGKTFGELLSHYDECSVIGVQNEKGIVMINPPQNTLLTNEHCVVAITSDIHAMENEKPTDIKIESLKINHQTDDVENEKERMLMLGWNSRGKTIIKELDNYVAKGSQLVLISSFREPKALTRLRQNLKNLELVFLRKNSSNKKVIREADPTSFDHVIVLSYKDDMSVQQADSNALITLLHLRQIAKTQNKTIKIVSEMMDVRNRSLAEITNADDFIVSDEITSLLMSQVAENKSLMAVFKDLFDADGSEIYLKPASRYVKLDDKVNFQTVVESCRNKVNSRGVGEVAIGYRLHRYARDPQRAYGVCLNPKKSECVEFTEEDKIILIAEG